MFDSSFVTRRKSKFSFVEMVLSSPSPDSDLHIVPSPAYRKVPFCSSPSIMVRGASSWLITLSFN